MQQKSPLVSQMEIITHDYLLARKLLTNIDYPLFGQLNVHECTDIVFKVDKAIYQLSKEERKFLNNEFFKHNNPEWWKGEFTKEEYILNLKSTIQHFLEAFYEVI